MHLHLRACSMLLLRASVPRVKFCINAAKSIIGCDDIISKFAILRLVVHAFSRAEGGFLN